MPYEEFDTQDPMELVGMVVPGDPETLEAMAACLVEEYVRLGWDEPRLMSLFVSPMFLATHRIYREKGEEYVRGLIRRTITLWARGGPKLDGSDPGAARPGPSPASFA